MRPRGILDPDAADDGGLEGLIGASSGKVSAGPPGRTRFFVLFPALRTGHSHCVPPPPVGIRLIKFDGQVFSGDLSDEACGDIRTIVDRVGEVGRFRIAPQGQERAYPNDQR
jgi:hypothetical protein